MAPYIPTDNTQSTKYAAAALKGQVRDYRAFGPPPSNYYTARSSKGEYMIYSDHRLSSAITTILKGAKKNHPCSDAAKNDYPRPTFSPELTFERQTSLGFFDPPLNYMPPQIRWKYHSDGWEGALAAELTKKGIPVDAAKMRNAYDHLASGAENKKEQSHILYHPADRGTAIFQGETAASLVARCGAAQRPFSLIIICPLVRADGIGWDRIYDTTNRPPIYPRWSTGDQGLYEPLVLMCIPVSESFKGRESLKKVVDWYSMDPTPKAPFETFWIRVWSKWVFYLPNFYIMVLILVRFSGQAIGKEAEQLRFPINAWPPFRWTLVMLHRRIAAGDQIPDEELGSWIKQYGQHLEKCGNPYKRPAKKFVFKKGQPYDGKKLTYHELTALIMNPHFGGGKILTAKRWDDAFDALIAYNLDRTDAKWQSFRTKMKLASTPYYGK